MGLTKRELVEYVRIAEHNQDVAEETLNQQAENVKDWIPVVRCIKCRYYDTEQSECKIKFDSDGERLLMPPDAYCSDGKRRKNDG